MPMHIRYVCTIYSDGEFISIVVLPYNMPFSHINHPPHVTIYGIPYSICYVYVPLFVFEHVLATMLCCNSVLHVSPMYCFSHSDGIYTYHAS